MESNWTGTRDYAATASLPAAINYLNDWRSLDGLTCMEFNRIGYQMAANELREAWRVNDPYDPAISELDPLTNDLTMGMVRLPPQLHVGDAKPGQPSDGLRQILRDQYGIEAAIGQFGTAGGFIRLSHAVYTTDEDIRRLRDAIYELSFQKS